MLVLLLSLISYESNINTTKWRLWIADIIIYLLYLGAALNNQLVRDERHQQNFSSKQGPSRQKNNRHYMVHLWRCSHHMRLLSNQLYFLWVTNIIASLFVLLLSRQIAPKYCIKTTTRCCRSIVQPKLANALANMATATAVAVKFQAKVLLPCYSTAV